MNIVNKFRKPSLSIFLASLVLFVSCNKEGLSVEDEIQHTDLTEFVNLTLSNNNFDARVNSVNHFKLEDYSKYTDKVESFSKNNNDIEPYSVEMNLEDRVFYLHTVPTSETHASLFIETEDGEINEMIELNVGEYNEITDESTLIWNYNSENYAKDPIYCMQGAAAVAGLGRLIQFGSFLGCGPCAFVGGALSAIGGAAFVVCFLMHVLE